MSSPWYANTATSSVAALTIDAGPPVILTGPAGQSTVEGESTAFSVFAYGAKPLSYQWRHGSTNMANGGRISGAVTSALTISNLAAGDAGSYTVVVTNTLGSVTSAVALLAVRGLSDVIEWGTTYPMSPGATNDVGIVAGMYWSLALRADGRVVAWGEDLYGKTNVPPSATNVVRLHMGAANAVAQRADGTLVAWGDDTYGKTTVPPAATNVVGMALNGGYCLALRADGRAVGWGLSDVGQTNVPASATNVLAIAAGQSHLLALRGNGTVVAWGDNTYYQTNVPGSATNVAGIVAGANFSLALRSNGTVVAWGKNTYLQTNVPASVTNVVALAAYGEHCAALRSDGTVVAWGWNTGGMSTVPDAASNVVSIAAGYRHNMALLGTAWPRLGLEPADGAVAAGQTVLFQLSAEGLPPLRYQWQFNGTNVAGGTNAWFYLPAAQSTNVGYYRVVVSNASGSVTSSYAGLTVGGVMPPQGPPGFDASPAAMQMTRQGFCLTVTNLTGQGEVVIWASTNLNGWQPIWTSPPVFGTLRWTNATATNTATRFYRASEAR